MGNFTILLLAEYFIKCFLRFEHLSNSFWFYSYANVTIGEQYPHEADGYEVERINAKVKIFVFIMY